MEQIRLHLGQKTDLVLFRNQSERVQIEGRWMRAGLAPGASDLIGILKPWGLFIAIEVKQPGKKPTKEQVEFINLVNAFGGFALWCTSVAEAEELYLLAKHHAWRKTHGSAT